MSGLTEKRIVRVKGSANGTKCMEYDGYVRAYYSGSTDPVRHHLITGYPCIGLKSGKTFAPSFRITDNEWVPHGRGVLRNQNGEELYSGAWSDGYRHGVGEGVVTNGDDENGYEVEGFYTGEWKAGLRDGFGTFIEDGISRYEGEWLQGKKHGKGTEEFAEGAKYVGYWKHGKRHGCGQMIYESGRVEDREYDGEELVSTNDHAVSDIERSLLVALDLQEELQRQKDSTEDEMLQMYDHLRLGMGDEDTTYKQRVRQLERQLKEHQSQYLCQLCATNPRDATVLPCLHFLYCKECIYRHEHVTKLCPACQVEIKAILVCKVE